MENAALVSSPKPRTPVVRMMSAVCCISVLGTSPVRNAEAVDPATVGTAISAAALSKEILSGINDALTTAARADAAAQSAGPDDDDPGSRATFDKVNGFWESDLDAWLLRDTGGLDLGPNSPNPHVAYVRMHVKHEHGAWVVVPDERYASAYADPDSTPVPKSDNRTAAAAVATFAHNHKIRKGFTVTDADDKTARTPRWGMSPRRTTNKSLALAPGAKDATVAAHAALVWSPAAFKLIDAPTGDRVTVVPPADRLQLFHNFAQLASSRRLRAPFGTLAKLPGTSAGIIRKVVDGINTTVDLQFGTVPPAPGQRADFTLAGATAVFATGTLPRAGRSDRELIEAYLMSPFVRFVAPDAAQLGYRPQIGARNPLGGRHGFPPTSAFAQDGGFGKPDPNVEGISPIDLDALVGLVVEFRGGLLEALNRAARIPGSSVARRLQMLSVGQQVELEFLVGANQQAAHAVETTNQILLVDPLGFDDVFFEGSVLDLKPERLLLDRQPAAKLLQPSDFGVVAPAGRQ